MVGDPAVVPRADGGHMNGATRDYRNGRKNNWRRWGWNRLAERIDSSMRNCPILYLAGPQDLDRAVAVSKGIRSTNLIAVDEHQPNVKRVRREGGVAICADIVDVLTAWPTDRPVAAVALDFCCGFEPELVRGLMRSLWRAPFANCWGWLNFQRGRDGGSNAIRADLDRLFTRTSKNRAEHFFLSLVSDAVITAHRDGKLAPGLTAQDCVDITAQHRSPIFRSYESVGEAGSVVVFDSLIYRAQPAGEHYARNGGIERYERQFAPSVPVRRLVGAALAVRTMRADRW
jgi:hypothetical protein